MAKPICVIYITQPKWSMEDFKKAQLTYDRRFEDYHVLAVPSQRSEAVEIEVHNCKNLNAIGLAELKKRIIDSLPKEKTHEQHNGASEV